MEVEIELRHHTSQEWSSEANRNNQHTQGQEQIDQGQETETEIDQATEENQEIGRINKD